MEVITGKFALLAILAALGYGVATIGMKLASSHWSILASCFIIVGFVAATQAEIVLMRGVTLSALYLVVIAFETLIVLTFAFCIGEGLSFRDAAGGALILLGLAIISLQA